MKKIFTILGVAAISLVSAQNLLTNPGFETGTLAPWVKGPTPSYTEPSVLNTGAHTGTYSANYVATATNGFYQEIPVVGGTTYTASFWYKVTASNNTARIWSVFKDASNTVIYYAGTSSDATTDPLRNNNEYLPASTTWVQKTVTFTAPASATVFQFAVRAYNGANASFDDFSVTTGNMAVTDLSKSKYSLVKNTVVKETIAFAKDSDIQIINTVGQVVKTAKATEGSTLNVSSLAKGVYIITGTVNGEKVSQKIIKE